MLTEPLRNLSISTILLDIEGTTTPIDFVYRVLFPYARTRMKKFLTEHLSSDLVRASLARLQEACKQPRGSKDDEALGFLREAEALMDAKAAESRK